jgi:N-acylneuraminate cytidylyltransferase
MLARVSVLAVVPARGGSRGIPGKNIHQLRGRPLLSYTIDEAKRARLLDRIVVSTEDPAIAAVAASLGTEVIPRPTELATDTAPTELALIHAVESVRARGFMPTLVVTLEPTSPLRRAATIDRCVELALDSGADSVICVVEVTAPLGRVVDGRFEYLVKGQARRRQDREPLYAECGVAYVTRVDVLVLRRSVIGADTRAVIVPPDEAIDINTPVDLVIAEALLGTRRGA